MDSKEALLHFQRLKEKADNQVVQFEKLFHQRSNHRKDAELFEMAIKAIKFKEYLMKCTERDWMLQIGI